MGAEDQDHSITPGLLRAWCSLRSSARQGFARRPASSSCRSRMSSAGAGQPSRSRSPSICCSLVMAPFAAALMQRFGLRRVSVAALITISAGVLLTTQMTKSWQLVLLWGVVVGLGTGSMTQVLAATVVNRWFATRRGMVLGVLTAASATGQLIFLPLLAWIAGAHGWRSVAIVVAIAALSVIPIIVLFLKEQPSDVGLERYGAKPGEHFLPPTPPLIPSARRWARCAPPRRRSISGCWPEPSSFAEHRRTG